MEKCEGRAFALQEAWPGFNMQHLRRFPEHPPPPPHTECKARSKPWVLPGVTQKPNVLCASLGSRLEFPVHILGHSCNYVFIISALIRSWKWYGSGRRRKQPLSQIFVPIKSWEIGSPGRETFWWRMLQGPVYSHALITLSGLQIKTPRVTRWHLAQR